MIKDRTISPATMKVDKLEYPELLTSHSKSGVPVYAVNDPNCDVLKIEFVFDGGTRVQQFPFQAQASNSLLTEGTTTLTAKQIADKLDFYGSYLQSRFGADDSSLTLYCLPKHLNSCLSVINDILNQTIYPQQELEILKKNSIQRLLVNESKTTYLARRAFYKSIFGEENCYGSSVNQGVISNISRETLLGFYAAIYKNKAKFVFVSGKISDNVMLAVSSLCEEFALVIPNPEKVKTKSIDEKIIGIRKEGSVQSTIRMGRSFLVRNHPDYRKVQFLNLLLGGYFGSRLMSNIREEKGLTYGIYSVVESYQDAGAFYIETDLNSDLVETGCLEIGKELQRLIDEPVSEKEIEVARNYMIGTFVRSFDGPFSIADRFKILIDFGLPKDYYNEFVEIINTVSSLELQELANKYFQKKDIYTIVAGKG